MALNIFSCDNQPTACLLSTIFFFQSTSIELKNIYICGSILKLKKTINYVCKNSLDKTR